MLRLTNVHKRFGDAVAVDGLSLEVAPGQVFGLLGPNGAGKSTTANMVVGALPPTSGTIAIGGRGAPNKPNVRRLIGVAPQALSLYDELTAAENVRFFATLYGLRGAARSARVDSVLEAVGLSDRRDDHVKTFSGGMKRRLNLATALAHEPELLILDEPTAGVDPQSRNAILEAIGVLRDQGKTVVYTTHYMEEAERICDEIAIIDHGKVLAQGTVDSLIETHGGASILVFETGGETTRVETEDPLAELNRIANGAPIDRFHVERPSLEDVFLNLTGRKLRD